MLEREEKEGDGLVYFVRRVRFVSFGVEGGRSCALMRFSVFVK